MYIFNSIQGSSLEVIRDDDSVVINLETGKISSVVTNVLCFDIVVSEFEFMLRFYVHFQTKALA